MLHFISFLAQGCVLYTQVTVLFKITFEQFYILVFRQTLSARGFLH